MCLRLLKFITSEFACVHAIAILLTMLDCNLSVVRPSIVHIATISPHLGEVFLNFQLLLPCAQAFYFILFLFLTQNAFSNLKFSWFYVIFVNMRPYGRKNFKPLLLPQIALEFFQTLNFLLIFPHKILIFSSAWLCQQSSWNRNSSVVRRPSVVRPSVVRLWHRLSLKLLHGLLSNFSCG